MSRPAADGSSTLDVYPDDLHNVGLQFAGGQDRIDTIASTLNSALQNAGGMAGDDDYGRNFGAKYDPPDELWLRVFFTPSEQSQAAGRKYLERQRARIKNRDPLPNEKVAPAQLAALEKWRARTNDPYAYLKKITQPTLVVNGSHDVIVYTVNSFILQQNLPNAQLILYPDANHGSQYQYPELFVRHATLFLNG